MGYLFLILAVVAIFSQQSHAFSTFVTGIYGLPAAIVVTSSYVSIMYKWGRDLSQRSGEKFPTGKVERKWIPHDGHRHIEDGLDFYVHIDTTQLPPMSQRANGESDEQIINAIKSAVNKWDNAQCSWNTDKFHFIIKDEYDDEDIGYGEYMISGGGSGKNQKIGDIVFGGFVPKEYCNVFGENAADSLIAMTVAYDHCGNVIDFPTKPVPKVAFVEIYFNADFKWGVLDESDEFTDIFDIETVALHEFAHALGEVHAPFEHSKVEVDGDVIMMAIYSEVNQDIEDVDLINHCDIWETWGLPDEAYAEEDTSADHESADSFIQIYNHWNEEYYIISVISVLFGCLISTIIWMIKKKYFPKNKTFTYNKVFASSDLESDLQ